MPSKNQQVICEQLEDCCLHYKLDDPKSLPKSQQLLVERDGRHAVLNVIEVSLEAGYPFTVQSISEFKQLRKLKVTGFDPIAKGCDPIFGFLELEELVFTRTSLNDLSGFLALKKLQKFGFYDLTTGTQGAEVFGELNFLTALHLNDHPVDQLQLDGIAKSETITDLSFTVNVNQLDLSPLSKMNQLVQIKIKRLEAVELDLSVLLGLKSLKYLDIGTPRESDSPVLLELERRGIHNGV